MRASIQFALNQILQAHVLQTSGDPASEVALRKFEKRVDTSGIDQSAVELLRITDMHKKFCHGCDAVGFLLLPEESSAPHFQAVL